MPSIHEINAFLRERGVDPDSINGQQRLPGEQPEISAQRPQTLAQSLGLTIGPEEIDSFLRSKGVDPQTVSQTPMNFKAFASTEKPHEERNRLAQEYERDQGMSAAPNWAFNPVVRGMADVGAMVTQASQIPANLATGLDVSGEQQKVKDAWDREYKKRFGEAPGIGSRLVSSAVGSLASMFAIGKTAGPTAYMATVGANAYDDGLRQGREHGIEGAQLHAYAGVDAAAEVLTEYIPWKQGWGALAETAPFKHAIRSQIKNLLWHVATKGGQEGAEESVNQLVQNANDAVHGVKPWSSVMDGVAEAGLVGGLVGGAAATPRGVAHHRKLAAQRAEQEAAAQESWKKYGGPEEPAQATQAPAQPPEQAAPQQQPAPAPVQPTPEAQVQPPPQVTPQQPQAPANETPQAPSAASEQAPAQPAPQVTPQNPTGAPPKVEIAPEHVPVAHKVYADMLKESTPQEIAATPTEKLAKRVAEHPAVAEVVAVDPKLQSPRPPVAAPERPKITAAKPQKVAQQKPIEAAEPVKATEKAPPAEMQPETAKTTEKAPEEPANREREKSEGPGAETHLRRMEKYVRQTPGETDAERQSARERKELLEKEFTRLHDEISEIAKKRERSKSANARSKYEKEIREKSSIADELRKETAELRDKEFLASQEDQIERVSRGIETSEPVADLATYYKLRSKADVGGSSAAQHKKRVELEEIAAEAMGHIKKIGEEVGLTGDDLDEFVKHRWWDTANYQPRQHSSKEAIKVAAQNRKIEDETRRAHTALNEIEGLSRSSRSRFAKEIDDRKSSESPEPILERARERAKTDIVEAEESRKRVEEAQNERAKEEAEKQKESRRSNRERIKQTRYFESLSDRAKAMKGTVEKIEQPGVAPTARRGLMSREALDSIFAIEHHREGEEKPSNRYILRHLPSGLEVASGATRDAAASAAVMLKDFGIELGAIKSAKDLPTEIKHKARRIQKASENKQLHYLNEEEQKAALETVKPREKAVDADILIDADDLGVSGTGLPISDHGIAHAGGRPFLLELAERVPEFGYNPVFTVTPEKKLMFRDHYKFLFEPSLLNLHPAELTAGQTVGVDLESMGIERLSPEKVIAQTFKNLKFETVRNVKGGIGLNEKVGPASTVVSGGGHSWKASGPDAASVQKVLDGIKWIQPGQLAASPPVASETDAAPAAENGETAPEKDIEFHRTKKGQAVPKIEPKEGKSAPLNENNVREALASLFDIPILRGRVSPGAQGHYTWADRVIRLTSKAWANVAVASHEVGHDIDHKLKFSRNADAAVNAELLSLDTFHDDPNKKLATEGFAEFVRHYLTTDEAGQYPATLAAFEKAIKNEPKIADALKKARELVDQLRERNPIDVVLSGQMQQPFRPPDTRTAWERFRDRVEEVGSRYMEWMHNSEWRALGLAKEAEKQLGRRVGAYYERWDRLRSSAYIRGQQALQHGVYTIDDGPDGKPERLSQSAKEILSAIKPDELSKFEGYVLARVQLHNIERKSGYDPGIDAETLKDAIAQVEADPEQYERFDKAAKQLRDYFYALAEMQQRAGAITGDELKRIKKSHPDYYFPLFRKQTFGVGDVLKKVSGGTRGMLTGRKTLRRLGQGSGDQFLPFSDAIIKETLDAHNAAVQYSIFKPWLRLLLPSMGGAAGFGHFITKVDPKSILDSVRLGKIIDQMSSGDDPLIDPDMAQRIKDVDALREGRETESQLKRLEAEYGTDDPKALIGLTQDVRSMKEAIQYWRKDFGSSDKEHVIHLNVDGQDLWVQIPDANLWQSMRGTTNLREAGAKALMYRAIADGFNKYVRKPTQALTIALSPTGVAALFPSDYLAFQVQSKHTGFMEGLTAPIYNIVRLAGAMLHEDSATARSVLDKALPGFLDRQLKAGTILRHQQRVEAGTLGGARLFGDTRLTTRNLKRSFVPQESQERWYHSLGDAPDKIKDWLSSLDSGVRLAELVGRARADGYRVNTEASWQDIQAGKNGWIGPNGKVVDSPPSETVAAMMTANNEVITNYKISGSAAEEIGKFIPFFQARLAGIAKAVGTMGELGQGMYRVTRGQPSGVENFGPRIARLAALAMMQVAYSWWRHRDDDYKGQDPNIAERFWTYGKNGVPIAKIPKPREYGIFFNTIEALMNALLDGKNPEVMKILGVEAQELFPVNSLYPVDWPAGVSALYQTWTNKDWMGRHIEFERDAEMGLKPEYRVRPETLETSKFLSHFFTKYLGLSPAKTEYLLKQTTGPLFGDVVPLVETGYRHFSEGTPINWRDMPIIRRQAAHGLYQRSIEEFRDLHQALKEDVATAKHEKWDTPETRNNALKFEQVERYRDAMNDLRKAGNEEKDFEKKLDLDRYSVGIADYALGKEARESYPNPLLKGAKDLPEPVEKIRKQFVLQLAERITRQPSISAARTPEKREEFPAKKEHAEAESVFASQELKRLGYSFYDVRGIVLEHARKNARKLSPQTTAELARALRDE
ncbi:MAG: LPD38 domain-containing protein [Acidiferrobacteraceae bacterium]